MSRVGHVKKLTDNRFLNLYELEATFRDGHSAPYYVASRRRDVDSIKAVTHDNHPDGVILYGVYGEKKDRVVLIRQFRFPVNDFVYEFPAGLVDPGVSLLTAGIREMKEETGLTLTAWRCRGVITFLTNDPQDGEYMYLFTADGFEGELKECDEGDLQWVSREFLDQLPKWEGDQIFLDLLWQDAPFFLLKLRYDGDKLVEAVLNGKKLR